MMPHLQYRVDPKTTISTRNKRLINIYAIHHGHDTHSQKWHKNTTQVQPSFPNI